MPCHAHALSFKRLNQKQNTSKINGFKNMFLFFHLKRKKKTKEVSFALQSYRKIKI